MTARWIAGVVLVLSLAAGGCGAKEGQRVITYKPGGDRLQETKARDAGRYTLHTGSSARDVTFLVQKGEPIGFRRQTGYVEAYAGDNPSVELERGQARTAYWQFTEKRGDNRRKR